MSTGITTEDCFPYEGRDDIPCNAKCDEWTMRSRRLTSANSIYGGRDAIKEAIVHGPLYTSMLVYHSFRFYAGGVYEPIPGEPIEGGHAVVMLGWNDRDSSWICKNSWGTGWGESGYFRIKWGTCEIEYDPWKLVPAEADYPYLEIYSYSINELNGDKDGVLNPGETANLVFTLCNQETWAYAGNVHLSLSCDSPYLQILSGEADFPDIPPGSVGDNSSNPFLITASPSIPTEPETLHLDITANGVGGLPSYEHQIDYPFFVSYSQYGWPFHTKNDVYSSPLLLSDSSGGRAVYFGAGDSLYKTSITGALESGFPIYVGSSLYNSQCAGDIDGDGNLEIVALPNKSPLYIFKMDGSLLNTIDFPLLSHVKATPALADLDDDGKLEIVFGSLDGYLYAFNYDGTNVSSNFPIDIGRNASIWGELQSET